MVTIKDQWTSGETGNEVIGKCFANAVMEVVRTTAGLEVYEDNGNIEKSRIHTGRVSGMMLLCGQRNALLSITMSWDAALTLVSYMTGTLPEEIEREELWDGAAELVNMIAGRAKVDLIGTQYHFSITPPFSISGEDYSIIYKNRMKGIYKKFAAEEVEIFLEVAYI